MGIWKQYPLINSWMMQYQVSGKHTSFQTSCQVRHGSLLILERRSILMMQPAQLLQDLCVIRIVLYDFFVSHLCPSKLDGSRCMRICIINEKKTEISHLLAAHTHAQFETKYQHERAGLGGFWVFVRSIAGFQRICSSACRLFPVWTESRLICQSLNLEANE